MKNPPPGMPHARCPPLLTMSVPGPAMWTVCCRRHRVTDPGLGLKGAPQSHRPSLGHGRETLCLYLEMAWHRTSDMSLRSRCFDESGRDGSSHGQTVVSSRSARRVRSNFMS